MIPCLGTLSRLVPIFIEEVDGIVRWMISKYNTNHLRHVQAPSNQGFHQAR